MEAVDRLFLQCLKDLKQLKGEVHFCVFQGCKKYFIFWDCMANEKNSASYRLAILCFSKFHLTGTGWSLFVDE